MLLKYQLLKQHKYIQYKNKSRLPSLIYFSIFRSTLAYGELEERLELLESSMTPISPHIEERLELIESLLSREQEEYMRPRHNKRDAEPYAEQVNYML